MISGLRCRLSVATCGTLWRHVVHKTRKLWPLYNTMLSAGLDGWMAGWLAGWQDGGWLAGWIEWDGWLARWLDGCWMAAWLDGWLAGLMVG